MACTWNKNLAEELGSQIGDEAAEIDVNGWYGPAMNIHRSAFSGSKGCTGKRSLLFPETLCIKRSGNKQKQSALCMG